MVGEGATVGLTLVEVEEGSWTGDVPGGEIEGTGEETEVDIPVGSLTEGVEAKGSPESTEEGSIAKLEETTLSEEAGDWVGRLAAGSVTVKKMVETMVTVTGSPAAGFVACGVSSEVGEGLFVIVSSTEEVEEGLTEIVEEGSTEGVEDGSANKGGSTEVAEGSTAVDVPGVPLERVTLGPSNSASLRERSECPSLMIPRAHQIPTSACQSI